MSHDDEQIDSLAQLTLSEEELTFLRDEGLDLLALFRSIRDGSKRQLISELVRAIAEGQLAANGSG